MVFLPTSTFYSLITSYMSALALMLCDTKAKTMSIFGYLIFKKRVSRPIRFAQPRFVIVSRAIVSLRNAPSVCGS